MVSKAKRKAITSVGSIGLGIVAGVATDEDVIDIASDAIIRIGTRIVNTGIRFWAGEDSENDEIVRSERGPRGRAGVHNGRTEVGPGVVDAHADRWCRVTCRIVLDSYQADWSHGRSAALAVVVDEIGGDSFVFWFEQRHGFEVSLPPGSFSFYALLLDPWAGDVRDAKILGIAMRSRLLATRRGNGEARLTRSLRVSLYDAPLTIGRQADYPLDLVVVPASSHPRMRTWFSDLLKDAGTADGDARNERRPPLPPDPHRLRMMPGYQEPQDVASTTVERARRHRRVIEERKRGPWSR